VITDPDDFFGRQEQITDIITRRRMRLQILCDWVLKNRQRLIAGPKKQ
jgi:hypothetical protein